MSLPPTINEDLFAHGVLVRDALPRTTPFPQCKKYPSASDWDHTSWPATKIGQTTSITKGGAKTLYRLSPKDLNDLPYKCWTALNGFRSKNYYRRQVERRAWEKYGGPSGLQAAINDNRSSKGKKRVAEGSKKTSDQQGKEEAHSSRGVANVSSARDDPVLWNERALSPTFTPSSSSSTAKRTNALAGKSTALDTQPQNPTIGTRQNRLKSSPVRFPKEWRGSSPTMVGSSPPPRKRRFDDSEVIELTDSGDESPAGQVAPSSKRRKGNRPFASLEVIEISD